jgi:protein-S-isoprenylcysteine O-methyltransferase Ste14
VNLAERTVNALIGLSALSWAILGVAMEDPAMRFAPARLSLAALNVVVAYLFIARRPLVRASDAQGVLLSLPCLVVGGFAWVLAPPANLWPAWTSALFAAGTVVAAVSLLCLGGSFAILPAVRQTVARGPYRVLRHPAYAAELVMLAACFLAGPRLVALAPLAAALPCVLARIYAEERLLQSTESYRQYAQRVRWRLLPGVW